MESNIEKRIEAIIIEAKKKKNEFANNVLKSTHSNKNLNFLHHSNEIGDGMSKIMEKTAKEVAERIQ
jgi:uncharacterized protein YjgD (DUF1641 family)